jgi:PAS domain S-box-containing protein|nr:PAS domain-containing protein [Phaeacidiphilus oryzae]
MLLDRLPQPIAICDAHGTVRACNAALAAECGTVPGALRGVDLLTLFEPVDRAQLRRITEAIRLRRRSRYPVTVVWTAADGTARRAEVSVDPVSDSVQEVPSLLVQLRFAEGGKTEPARAAAGGGEVSPIEAQTLALLAGGATTDQAARALGLTRDGVTYHLRRLSARWGAANRTELVARGYACGALAPGCWPPRPA